MTQVSFVRRHMLDQKPPPPTSVGAVGWLRANLFAGPVNTALSLVSGAFIIFVLSSILPWAVSPTWNAASLNECRGILAEMGREGHFAGACWGVINDRWVQLLFGFYPSELYWRPILAFVLLAVALAPVLFAEYVPGKLIWATAAYPFVMPWLLWGGAVWVPLLVLLGFVLAIVGYRVITPRFGSLPGLIGAVLVAVLWFSVGQGPVKDGIERGLGAMRLETQTAKLTERSAELSASIASLEGQIDDVAAEINEKLTGADAALAQGDGAYHALIRELAPTREHLGDLRREMGAATVSLSEIDGLLKRIAELPTLQASLPELEANAAALRAALPSSVASVDTPNAYDVLKSKVNAGKRDISRADMDQLGETIEAEGQVLVTKGMIQGSYAEVSRIGLRPVKSRKFGGLMLSLTIGVVAIGFSLPIGIVLALGRQSTLPLLRGLCVGFIELIRGVPLITLLFVASTLLNIFMPPGTNFDIILRVIIMATLFASAYMAEVVRGGLAALPKGQYEGADSLGLDYWQAQRLIIMPQALKISIPGIVSTFIGLFKDTTLVSIIALLDPLGLSNAIRADVDWNGIVWELYGFIAFLFFIFCFSMSRYSMYLERKLQTGHR